MRITIHFKTFKLHFICSNLLLIRSLSDLAEKFLMNEHKNQLPYTFITGPERLEENNLEMLAGLVPKPEVFTKDWLSLNCKNLGEYTEHYCVQDVNILAKVIITFIKTFENEFKVRFSYKRYITLSKLSQDLFILKFYKNDIVGINTRSRLDDFIRKSYHGGKTEVFQGWKIVETNKVYYYDWSSIYGKAMQITLPVGNPLWFGPWKDVYEIKTLFTWLKKINYVAFISATIKIPERTQFPTLPKKHTISRAGGPKLVFPTGNFEGNWYSYELELAIKHGALITSIDSLVVFKGGNPINEYSTNIITHKDEIKKEGNHVLELIYKLLNNSIYGKFGISLNMNLS